MEFRDLFIGFLLIGLFIFSMITFAVQFASDNGSNMSIIDDSRITTVYSGINNTLSSAQGMANAERKAFETEVPFVGFGSLIFFAIVGVGKTFGQAIVSTFQVVGIFITDIIGGGGYAGAIVFATLSAILLGTIIFFAWSLYKVGR